MYKLIPSGGFFMEKYEEKKMSARGMLTNCLFGAVLGLLLTFVLLYVFAVLVGREILPVSLQTELVIAAAFLGVTCGAVIGVKRQGRGILQTGACTGVIFILLVFAISALLTNGHVLGEMTIKIIICGVAGGLFGGALCLKRGKQKPGKRSRGYTKRNHRA